MIIRYEISSKVEELSMTDHISVYDTKLSISNYTWRALELKESMTLISRTLMASVIRHSVTSHFVSSPQVRSSVILFPCPPSWSWPQVQDPAWRPQQVSLAWELPQAAYWTWLPPLFHTPRVGFAVPVVSLACRSFPRSSQSGCLGELAGAGSRHPPLVSSEHQVGYRSWG